MPPIQQLSLPCVDDALQMFSLVYNACSPLKCQVLQEFFHPIRTNSNLEMHNHRTRYHRLFQLRIVFLSLLDNNFQAHQKGILLLFIRCSFPLLSSHTFLLIVLLIMSCIVLLRYLSWMFFCQFSFFFIPSFLNFFKIFFTLFRKCATHIADFIHQALSPCHID